MQSPCFDALGINMAQSLKNLVNRFIENQDSWQLQLLAQWDTIVGSLKTRVQLIKIEKDTLILGVTDACWMQELYLLTPLLLQTINKHLGKIYIHQLRFKAIGNNTKKGTQSFKTMTSSNACRAELTESEKKAIDSIIDGELAQELKNYLIRCKTQL